MPRQTHGRADDVAVFNVKVGQASRGIPAVPEHGTVSVLPETTASLVQVRWIAHRNQGRRCAVCQLVCTQAMVRAASICGKGEPIHREENW